MVEGQDFFFLKKYLGVVAGTSGGLEEFSVYYAGRPVFITYGGGFLFYFAVYEDLAGDFRIRVCYVSGDGEYVSVKCVFFFVGGVLEGFRPFALKMVGADYSCFAVEYFAGACGGGFEFYGTSGC